MKNSLLLKGLEEEVYAGTADGRVVGLSHRVKEAFPDYECEPDSRNIEYTTEPYRDYDRLKAELMLLRMRLRDHLQTLGNYTLISGGSLSLGNSNRFYLSDADNPYYQYIKQAYGTNVVTASTHINIGIEDPELLLRTYRVIRMEASLFLALSACSPFLDGRVTGYHSIRWHMFPRTPELVPFFTDHAEYVKWVETQLETEAMQNIRHLWLSVRPNGRDAPYRLERLELRICDRMDDPDVLLAVTVLLESRVRQIMDDSTLDLALARWLPEGSRHEKLMALAADNEEEAARHSLDAKVRDWRSGRSVSMQSWLESMIDEVLPVAKAHGIADRLRPLMRLLSEGNTAQQWLALYENGLSVSEVIQQAMRSMSEKELERTACAC